MRFGPYKKQDLIVDEVNNTIEISSNKLYLSYIHSDETDNVSKYLKIGLLKQGKKRGDGKKASLILFESIIKQLQDQLPTYNRFYLYQAMSHLSYVISESWNDIELYLLENHLIKHENFAIWFEQTIRTLNADLLQESELDFLITLLRTWFIPSSAFKVKKQIFIDRCLYIIDHLSELIFSSTSTLNIENNFVILPEDTLMITGRCRHLHVFNMKEPVRFLCIESLNPMALSTSDITIIPANMSPSIAHTIPPNTLSNSRSPYASRAFTSPNNLTPTHHNSMLPPLPPNHSQNNSPYAINNINTTANNTLNQINPAYGHSEGRSEGYPANLPPVIPRTYHLPTNVQSSISSQKFSLPHNHNKVNLHISPIPFSSQGSNNITPTSQSTHNSTTSSNSTTPDSQPNTLHFFPSTPTSIASHSPNHAYFTSHAAIYKEYFQWLQNLQQNHQINVIFTTQETPSQIHFIATNLGITIIDNVPISYFQLLQQKARIDSYYTLLDCLTNVHFPYNSIGKCTSLQRIIIQGKSMAIKLNKITNAWLSTSPPSTSFGSAENSTYPSFIPTQSFTSTLQQLIINSKSNQYIQEFQKRIIKTCHFLLFNFEHIHFDTSYYQNKLIAGGGSFEMYWSLLFQTLGTMLQSNYPETIIPSADKNSTNSQNNDPNNTDTCNSVSIGDCILRLAKTLLVKLISQLQSLSPEIRYALILICQIISIAYEKIIFALIHSSEELFDWSLHRDITGPVLANKIDRLIIYWKNYYSFLNEIDYGLILPRPDSLELGHLGQPFSKYNICSTMCVFKDVMFTVLSSCCLFLRTEDTLLICKHRLKKKTSEEDNNQEDS